VSPPSTCARSGHVLWRRDVAGRHGPDAARRGVYPTELARDTPAAVIDWHPPTAVPSIPMSDDQQHGGGQRQCRRGITPDVELGAALALADMAGSSVGLGPAHERAQAKGKARPAVVQLHTGAGAEEAMTDDEEMASTRLSLQLGRVGIQSSSCSSGSSAGRPSSRQPAPATHGPRPRHMLTEVITNIALA
jgi:hypothetical protein